MEIRKKDCMRADRICWPIGYYWKGDNRINSPFKDEDYVSAFCRCTLEERTSEKWCFLNWEIKKKDSLDTRGAVMLLKNFSKGQVS